MRACVRGLELTNMEGGQSSLEQQWVPSLRMEERNSITKGNEIEMRPSEERAGVRL